MKPLTIDSLGLQGPIHSLDLLQSLAKSVESESEYKPDAAGWDDWRFDQDAVIKAITTEGQITIADDCDWQRAMLWVLMEIGWKPEYLCECVVDSNPGDIQPFDHYVALAWVPEKRMWYGFNCWIYGRVVSLQNIVAGEYRTNGGAWAAPVRVDRHHLLSDFRNGQPVWYGGLPPDMSARQN